MRLELSDIWLWRIASDRWGVLISLPMMLSRCLPLFLIACLWLTGCNVTTSPTSNGIPAQANEPSGISGQALQTGVSPQLVVTHPPTPPSNTATQVADQILSTATPVFTVSLGLEQASAEDPPELPADLIYLSDGKLMRWDHINAFPVAFVDTQLTAGGLYGQTQGTAPHAQVVEYSLDATQRWIAMLVARGITANGVDLFDIAMLDFETGELVKLSENNRRSSHINLSPDGKWLVYQVEEDGIHIRLLRAVAGSEPLTLGECVRSDSRGCETAEWSPDSQKLLWSDERGIWYYEIGDVKPANLFREALEVMDASGEVRKLQVEYEGAVWSPRGRYALTTIRTEQIELFWTGLLDNRTGRMVEVPETYGSENPSGRVAWLEDGRVLVVTKDIEESRPAQIKIWRVLPAHDDLLVLDEVLYLRSLSDGDNIVSMPARSIFAIDAVTPINSRLVCLVMRTAGYTIPPSLYCLDLKYRLLHRIVEVPHDIENLEFSPDNSGIIITGSHGSTLYSSTDGIIYLDLNPLLGDNPGKIAWIVRPSAGKRPQ